MEQYRIIPMNERLAAESCTWTYDGPYQVYGHDPENPSDIEEINPLLWHERDFAVLDKSDEFVGIYHCDFVGDTLIVEIYLRPDHVGVGLGQGILRQCLCFSKSILGRRLAFFKLFVNDFNKRAICVYEKLGFHVVGDLKAISSGPIELRWLGREYRQLEMLLEADRLVCG